MFYGRVDVYWPDGPIESYRLDKPAIAIGRSTGNDIVLDTTAISRYHITLTVRDQQILLEDLQSVNGTYVDGVRLSANEPFVVRGGEEIQIGDIRLIYHPPLEMTAVSEDTTQRVVLSQPTFRVELEGPDMAVAPGAHVQSLLKIHNMGDRQDRYFVEIDGLPTGWVRADRVELELAASEQGQVVISFKPLRRSESQPGKHPFTVRVRSKSNPSQAIDAPAVLEVLPFSGFGIAMGDSHVKSDETFRVYIHNQGNAPLGIQLHGVDPSRTLAFQLPANRVILGAGEHRAIVGSVKLRRRRLFGSEREHKFAVVARSQDAAHFTASVPGRFVEQGVLPTWAPALIVPAIAFLVFVVGAGLWLLLSGDDQPEPVVVPSIVSFTVANPSVVVGEQANLSWIVSDAETIRLRVDNALSPVDLSLDPASTTYGISFDQSGRYTFVLEARHGAEVASATAAVEVRPVVSLALAVSDESGELVRYVRHDVQVTWQVEGAREFDGQYNIWIEGAGQGVPLVAAPQPAAGAQTVTVIPSERDAEWLVTLHAEGGDGVQASVTQKLAIVNPICELSADETVIRVGPGVNYPPLLPPQSSVAGGTLSFSPTARDPEGEWLQVVVGVGEDAQIGWASVADFSCMNFDPGMLRPSYDFAPPPVTLTPVATGTTAATSPPRASATPQPGPTMTELPR